MVETGREDEQDSGKVESDAKVIASELENDRV